MHHIADPLLQSGHACSERLVLRQQRQSHPLGCMQIEQVTGKYPHPGLSCQLDGPGHIIADHTFVPVPYREQGIAEAMVERLIADARTNGDKITPTCWFVADEFTRHSPDWDDLLRR